MAENPEDVAAYQAYRQAKERDAKRKVQEAAERKVAETDRAFDSVYGDAAPDEVLDDAAMVQKATEEASQIMSNADQTIRDMKGDDAAGQLLHIATTDNVKQACDFLAERRIGLVLVCDTDGTLAGVLSERDVIGAVAEYGSDALRMTVDNFITRDVFTCKSDDRITDVAKVMSERKFRHVPIVDDGTLKGMVSATDIVNYFAHQGGD